MRWPLNTKLLLMCKGRPQLSSRVRIRDNWTFLNKKMERVFSFLFAIEKEESKKWGKERRRWVTVVGTEDWVAKCPATFEEWWLSKFHLTPLAMWTPPHTFTEVCHSRTLLPSVSGSQWKLKERVRSCLGVAVWNRVRAAVAKWSHLDSGA